MESDAKNINTLSLSDIYFFERHVMLKLVITIEMKENGNIAQELLCIIPLVVKLLTMDIQHKTFDTDMDVYYQKLIYENPLDGFSRIICLIESNNQMEGKNV